MFHRIKHLILLVAGIAALAAATLTPIASAAPKTQTVDDETCAQWAGWFNDDFAQAAAYDRAGNTQLANDYYARMAHDYQLAHDAGCDWAQQVAPPYRPATHLVAVSLGGAVIAR